MFPLAAFLLSDNLDLLGTIITVIKSYLLLDANTVMSMYGHQLFNAIVSALDKVMKPNVKDIIALITHIIRLTPAPLWGEPMHSSRLFAKLANNVIEDKENALILIEHFFIFSRMTLADANVFNQLVASSVPGPVLPTLSETQVFEGLLDQWWAKFDNMAYPQHRKLVAMGIAAWVATGRPEVLGRLNTEIFNLWLDVFGELKEAFSEENTDDRSPLTMFWKNSQEIPDDLIEDDVERTVEADRLRAVHQADPINNTKLTVFVQEKLQQAEMICGTDYFRTNYLDRADPAVLQQLTNELMTGR
ncbi:hypothetical protein M422DRAFT_50427 [Sphaerobolus stellatus SS14]|uniref:Importin-7/11-like TPR repeats domain-containing protein n=1 Tax=Sphaerobolus stellatus (strain SS14) TaxID=990650 RepID=A0A0C9URE2_SPHS4|nr:hypothetical protein M422DRAFT_50427 [Sphaerobolus stellatus SS14]